MNGQPGLLHEDPLLHEGTLWLGGQQRTNGSGKDS